MEAASDERVERLSGWCRDLSAAEPKEFLASQEVHIIGAVYHLWNPVYLVSDWDAYQKNI